MINEGARMKYINAETLLPDGLVKELQQYIQGGYLYVLANAAERRHWGELSGYRTELQQRNREIIGEYRNGVSVESLAERYHLSVYGIRKIIYRK